MFKVNPKDTIHNTNAPVLSSFEDFIFNVLGGNKTTLEPCCEPPTKKHKDSTIDSESDDRLTAKPDVSEYPFEAICADVTNIQDLIKLGKAYSPDKKMQTTIDLWKVSKLVDPLEELDSMIGLKDVKQSIFDEILPVLQGLDDKNKDWYHSVIKGPPGVGKTKLCGILAKIYKSLGILPTDKVHSVKPDDLVAGYVGQTAIKTRKRLEEAIGGILLIDEAYSFGDDEQRDSFKKEALDILTSFLSERGHEFICIIAGYKDALERRFFAMNEGLARRFRIHYEIKAYEACDMNLIFQKICKEGVWDISSGSNFTPFFKENKDKFPHFGGDCLSLFTFAKKAHSKRLMNLTTKDELDTTKKKLNLDDVTNGFTLYCERNGYKLADAKPYFMYS
jgi:SpoVK/Ycf46/Vps4 family AAA+-type ATPase